MLLALAHTSQYGLWIAAWWLLGRAALQGRLDTSWLSAWTLALLTLVPLQLAALWLQGRVAISVGALLKQRLLTGAFSLEPEEVRREGAGHLLGRVIEAEAVESLALGGGFMALLAALELLVAACVLAVASPLLSTLLVLWTAVAAALAWIFFRRRLGWVRMRIALTLDLIEGMIGHRTRIAQVQRADWHRGEDETLERYVHASAAMDRAAVSLLAVVPRGWIIVGLFGLSPHLRVGTGRRCDGTGARDRARRNPARLQGLSSADSRHLEPRGRRDRLATDRADLSCRGATAIGTRRDRVEDRRDSRPWSSTRPICDTHTPAGASPCFADARFR